MFVRNRNLYAGLFFLSFFLLVFTGCKDGEDGNDGITTIKTEVETAYCYQCHTENSTVGNQILAAKSGWDASVHANGQQLPIIGTYWDSTNSVNVEEIIGWDWGGSMASMGNGSGCQVCHTHQGFLNKLNGVYNDATGDFSPAIAAEEVIATPAPPNCFTCHAPHTNENFALRVVAGTTVKTQTLVPYTKPKGSICVTCHQANLLLGTSTANTTVSDLIAGYLPTSPSTMNLSASFGPHYGAQADVLVGVATDNLDGTDVTIGTGAMYDGKSYANSAHSSSDDANCVNCHMTLRADTTSYLSSNVGGHSFEISGLVLGEEEGNAGGCASCHNLSSTVDGVAVGYLKVAKVGDPGALPVTGYLRTGMVYFEDTQDLLVTTTPTASVTAEIPAQLVNNILVKLADPDNSCAGLLDDAYLSVTSSTINWTNDGVYNHCHISSFNGEIPTDSGTNNDNATRLLKGIWNFNLATVGDKSMGIHNADYTLQLLYDSCDDLDQLVYSSSTRCNIANRPEGTATINYPTP